MTGFWAGSVPAWAYVVGVLLVNAGLLTGMWIGWGRGFEAGQEEAGWAREQAKARRVHPVFHRHDSSEHQHSGLWPEPEVAHEAWLAHTEQAMHLANETYSDGPSLVELDAYGGYRDEVAPDPRTDSQWTADHIADLDEFMTRLLGQHPVEEL